MTVNQNITDGLIKHQTHFARLSKSEAKKALRIFKKYNIKFLGELKGIKSAKKKSDIKKLLKEIRTIDEDLFQELLEYSNERLSAVYAEEIAFISALHQKALKKEFPKTTFEFQTPREKNFYEDEVMIGEHAKIIGGKLVVDGVTFSSMLLALQDSTYKKLEQKINYAFSSGEGYAYLEQELGETPEEFIQSTQKQYSNIFVAALLAVEDEANNDFQQENKNAFPFGYYVAVLDNKTTPVCMSLHGNRYPINEGPRPPQHYNCRSQFIMEVDLDDELGHLYPYNIIKEKMGHVKVYKDFDEFLRQQPTSFLEEILGFNRARLYKENKLPIKSYIDINDNRFYTLEEMNKKNKKIFEELQ